MKALRVGDLIAARRKVQSNVRHNLVVGPISALYDDAFEVKTNFGTEIERTWSLCYSDWTIQMLKEALEVKP